VSSPSSTTTAPAVVEWRERRPREDLGPYVARTLLDQAAYGAGVLAGCARRRTFRPLLPRRKAGTPEPDAN
jgi:hypothetical protein